MRKIGSIGWLAIALGTAAACSSLNATAQRSGRFYPSLTAGCPVRFENLTFQEANAGYEQVGLVTLTGTSNEPQAWEGTTRERLWPKVCEIGGTVVTPNGMGSGSAVMGMGTGMIQFAVWHERPATSGGEASAAAPTGTP